MNVVEGTRREERKKRHEQRRRALDESRGPETVGREG